ncbi:hypothetical protein FSP39_002700 [Pinctada imbricata]|uniref:Uncharacterized protein n=1 Tax=Pinctada imbricata TaxID=66713 RepID=A0AA88Y236_PINIB|nr:hypothetical protein FSP39_002700 [Pinctada imbricata]
MIILGKYFEKKRGLTNSIAISFGSLGGFVQPILFTAMMAEFSLRGALLLQGGILFNCIVAAALSRPLQKSIKFARHSVKTDHDDDKRCALNLQSSEVDLHESKYEIDDHNSVLQNRKRLADKLHLSETDNFKKSTSSIAQYSSAFDLYSVSIADISENIESSAPKKKLNRNICSYLVDFSVLKNKLVLLFTIVFCLASMASCSAFLFIPPHARDRGLSEQEVSIIASLICVAEFVSRLLLALIADRKFIQRYQIIMIALLMNGITLQFSWFLRESSHFLAFTICYGMFSGALISLYAPVCVDFIGVDNFHKAMGVLHMGQGITIGATGFILALLVEAVLLEKLSCRQIIIFGGFFTTIAIILSSFAERIEVLIFTHGILIALGSVCLHGPSLIILGKYFDKRRGMSNSIALAFGSIGGLIHPIMFTTFVNTFGLRGALLMQAGVMFHSVLGGALSRPITLSEKIQRLEFKDQQSIDNDENNLDSLLSEDERRNVQVANGQNETTITDYGDQEYQVHKIRTSLDMLEPTSCTSHNETSIVDTRKVFKTKCCGYDIKNVLRKFDFKMLKNKLVLLFSLVFGFATVSSVLGQMYIPPLARDRGVSEDLIGYLAASVGASELMGRIILAFIADTRHIHKYQILMIALFFNGLVQQFSRLTRTFEHLMIFSVSYGLFCGAMHSLYTPICIDFVGLEDFHKALGILHMIQGLITGIMGYTIGKYQMNIREKTI